MDFLFTSGDELAGASLAYCGPPPTPEILAAAWNLDPWLIAGLIALAAVYLRARPAGFAPSRDAAFWTAMALLVALFVSPLCALSVALFSARVAHHAMLVAVVAPLLVYGAQPALRAWPRVPLSAAFIVHAALFWIWHAPAPYALALASDGVYWLMQVTLFLSAAAFWTAALDPDTPPASALAGGFGSILQMGMLGALFVFAATPLQAPHALTTLPFGLTPLEDQQLAGLIMWVPANLPYLGVALHRLHRLLGPSGRVMDGKA
ncbi:MAG: cytochrome c oxidase assembly protein [Alphaproteobacteria bacterium]